MIRIECVNPNCPAPGHKFNWDESRPLAPGGWIAQPREQGSVRVIAVCPYCATENIVWVRDRKPSSRPPRGG